MSSNRPTLLIKRLDNGLPLPQYKTAGAVGIDLCSAETIVLGKFATHRVKTGVAIELLPGYEAQIRPRSSTSADGVLIHLGTIDTDYRGELLVIVTNNDTLLRIERGDRIAQLVIAPVAHCDIIEVDKLSETGRGIGGFGSTGK